MERIVRGGAWDLIGAARPSIADPFLPAKIRDGRAGRDPRVHRLQHLHLQGRQPPPPGLHPEPDRGRGAPPGLASGAAAGGARPRSRGAGRGRRAGRPGVRHHARPARPAACPAGRGGAADRRLPAPDLAPARPRRVGPPGRLADGAAAKAREPGARDWDAAGRRRHRKRGGRRGRPRHRLAVGGGWPQPGDAGPASRRRRGSRADPRAGGAGRPAAARPQGRRLRRRRLLHRAGAGRAAGRRGLPGRLRHLPRSGVAVRRRDARGRADPAAVARAGRRRPPGDDCHRDRAGRAGRRGRVLRAAADRVRRRRPGHPAGV